MTTLANVYFKHFFIDLQVSMSFYRVLIKIRVKTRDFRRKINCKEHIGTQVFFFFFLHEVRK